MSESSNPFSGLISVSDTRETGSAISENNQNFQPTNKVSETIEDVKFINEIIENVFHITLNKEAFNATNKSDKQLVYLEELAESSKPNVLIDLELLEHALFERLLLENIEASVIPQNQKSFKEHVIQKQVFPYLFSSLQNLHSYSYDSSIPLKNAVHRMKELIFRNAVTALLQPELFDDQYFPRQLVELLQHVDPQSHVFFSDVVKAFVTEAKDRQQLKVIMQQVIRIIHSDVNKSNIINLPLYVLPSILLFAGNKDLALILLETCEPKNQNNGRVYQDNVIGALLCLSALPKTAASQYEFFDNPMDQASSTMTETSIWNAATHLVNYLHKTFLTLLKGGPEIKTRTLSWIGKCLKTNAPRGKLWNVQAGEVSPASLLCVSDGFMINLGAVLLQLCQPFCATPDDPKALKIDPTYAAVLPEECAAKSVHLDCLHSETCLLPPKEGEDGQSMKRPTADSFNFVTECFFMTQKCIDLGVRVCADKLWRCGQDLSRAQRALNDVAAASAAHLVEPLRQRLQLLMTKLVSLRCALLERSMQANLHRLQATTSVWLVQVAMRTDTPADNTCFAPTTLLPVNMPITTPPPDTLRCIPEFVLDNVVGVITLSRRAATAASDECDVTGLLTPALTLVLTFMGDSSRMYNPHLRARLAECLDAMLPNHPEEQLQLSSLASFYREQLFKEHPHRSQLVPCLLDVFVGIEMTGQSVEFEQKFNYRRPMYLVMDFLWSIDEHKEIFTRLAREAEANMEAVHPPLFLRFVNLLINDAIFLLDETLTNMADIRNMETARESGAWTNLPAQEREQNFTNLSHAGMLARFDNILGRDTIRTLVRLTAHAPYVFCHPTLVERIASMLNYFLMNLVGPNKKNFKVKDMKEFEFDPASTVMDICRIYVVLGDNERFCAAVSDDGRSYSPQLFTLAEAVLVRIGGGALISSLREVGSRVARLAEVRQREEEVLGNAPEDFLDPIMSTIMRDPVLLPSSKITVDRTTIARHLLSDQSDPFNRSPLSMDQVKSNTELKERIDAWIAEQKSKTTEPSISDEG